ncbi:ribosome assembly protein METTL17, mitochondrial [Onthophagus taurus]|uniref:ribosome assembly protein METTL17, mitochondrial n=1 Tax=Onthophagus taurus TaxID=166361 RepID=UPI0039BDDE59
MLRRIRLFNRKLSTNVKPKVIADENVISNVENQSYKARHHPGIVKLKTVSLPDNIVKAITKITADYPIKALVTNSDLLGRHLRYRVPPMESDQLNDLKHKLYKQELWKEKDSKIQSEEKFHQKIKDKVKILLKEKVYNWSPINYDQQQSLLYLFARSSMEYAVLAKIFLEISNRDPDFKPRTLFDFGSGVGSVTWAANTYWKKHLFEYYNVDISSDMNDLALTILRGGPGYSNQNIKGVFYRQFLPATNVMFDLVVSAYSLLELPSFNTRMDTILRLWNKTNKYLIIVENGSNAGFKVINEARDFILKMNQSNQGHIFSPCPHDLVCPRFLADDNTPCNFEINYFHIPLTNKFEMQKERYSYIVFKKSVDKDSTQNWPRVVRETLVRSKHCICRTCTADGKLSEVIFTASKHGKTMYHCARSTKWGDRLPIILDENAQNSNNLDTKTNSGKRDLCSLTAEENLDKKSSENNT